MFKLMKYEIRGTYRFVLATILVVALAMIGMQYTMSSSIFNAMTDSGQANIMLIQILFPILSIVLIAASIAFLVHLIQSFRKELYEDRGYLTFTLPLTGKEILGAKFIIAVLWSVLFAAVLLAINAIVFSILFENFQLERMIFQLKTLVEDIGVGVISGILVYGIISSLVTLLTVYFSITLSKIAIKNRTIGGLWILIFIGLQMLFGFIEGRITNLFPLYTDFSNGFNSSHNLLSTEFGFSVDIMAGSPVLSVSALIYWIVLGVGLFLLTSYLLDRKIEL